MNNSSKSPLLNQLPNKTESGSSFDPLPQSYFKHPEKTHVLPYPQTACSPAKNSQAKRVSDILSGLSYRPTTKIQRQKSPPPALSAQTTEILARVKEKKERENVSTGAVKVASRVQEERVIEQNSNDSSAMSNEEKSSDNPRIHDQSLSEPVAAVTVTPTLTTLIVTDTPMPPVAERIDASTPDKISTTSTPSRGSGRGGRRGRGIRRKISPITPEIIRNEIDTAAGATEMPVRDPLSGRGRGRGSRGFPRKPRGSVALTTPAADRPTARGARGGGIGGSDALKRGAKGSGGKRKRGDDEGDEDAEDTDASETITPLPTQSRSGRKIFKATTFTPVIKIDDEDGDVIDSSSTRVARPIATGNAGNGTTLMPPTAITTVAGQTKNKKRRQTGATAVCKNCGRGPSPASNVIVFCDGCNKPWHQYCHDPPVKGEVLQIEEQEWFCADCAILREDKGILEGRGPARTDMGLGEKRNYLNSLPHKTLVSLLIHACSHHIDLPIFPSLPLPTLSSRTRTPSTIHVRSNHLPPSTFPNLPLQLEEIVVEAEEEEEEDEEEELDVLPYPKAGNGIAALLPPESEDLDYLLDENIDGAFSHSWLDSRGRMVNVGA